MEKPTERHAGFELHPLGDAAVIVQFAKTINPDAHRSVQALTAYLDAHGFPGFVEAVPAFASVAVYYDPRIVMEKLSSTTEPASCHERVCTLLAQMIRQLHSFSVGHSRVVEIPVCYGEECGPDLPFVAQYHRLTCEEVIAIHSSAEYLVYMIGFAPGFPYLGGMPERIATPRRETPRLSIPPGTVGIGGRQTGIYPLATPGGWHCIGRTPLPLFRPDKHPPSLLQAGDRVRFRPISHEAYAAWKEQAP
ncbi:5-oxoprolinase subunit PxpB [Brevibacillus sp. SYP-B805]|uniref:5-oxoprolinase subunit PxpB n=1 Tax=Brevibacillus sp. SYP-B805 TaxID=1578199 RepID=UPI0013EDA9CC|nr:5-oxoprolinase subunit PxpB [Brevibacillus sp. SYP-B805]NGQ93669.1 5-oxoprolinase subunit PxpB [Brevibacillus sp. SYP-B805]